MNPKDTDEMLAQWQILGLSLILLSENADAFYALIQEEFGYIWDGKGWVKPTRYH